MFYVVPDLRPVWTLNIKILPCSIFFPISIFKANHFAGKSLIGKEKAIQTAEREDLNLNPNPVFFISLVGVDEIGMVDEYEHIFDIKRHINAITASVYKCFIPQSIRSHEK